MLNEANITPDFEPERHRDAGDEVVEARRAHEAGTKQWIENPDTGEPSPEMGMFFGAGDHIAEREQGENASRAREARLAAMQVVEPTNTVIASGETRTAEFRAKVEQSFQVLSPGNSRDMGLVVDAILNADQQRLG